MKERLKGFLIRYSLYLGIALFIVSIIFMFIYAITGRTSSIIKPIANVLWILSCGVFGAGVTNSINKRNIRKYPEKAKEYEIQKKDERNIHIREKAGYAAFIASLIELLILFVIFLSFTDSSTQWQWDVRTWLITGVFAFQMIVFSIFIYIYKKRM